MNAKQAVPCSHAGVPPIAVVEKVSALIEALASDDAFLASKGISPAEYRSAFPIALEAMRGSQSASNADRRHFLVSIFEAMVARGLICKSVLRDLVMLRSYRKAALMAPIVA